MFSGITQGLFTISEVEEQPGLTHYAVTLNAELIAGLKIGHSVSVDGVCQTVTEINDHDVHFSAIEETLRLTTLNQLSAGKAVSIERSLRYGDDIGGHLISGHVIGTAAIDHIKREANNLTLTLRCPPDWMPYILPKGFIAVDGSSLTVGDIDLEGRFKVHLIPETIRLTHLGQLTIGARVNIELDHTTRLIVDTVAKLTKTLDHSDLWSS